MTTPTVRYAVTLRYLRTGRVRQMPALYPSYERAGAVAKEWQRLYCNQGRRVVAGIVAVKG